MTPKREPAPTAATPARSRDVDRIVREFERAWQDGMPNVDDFLPPDGDPQFRLQLLHALIALDLESRHRAGEPVRLESYLGRYAELQEAREITLDLIAHEYELRSEDIAGSSVDEYLVRFPTFCAQLPQRLSGRSSRKRRVRLNCPHCDNPIVVFTKPDDSATCSVCAEDFEVQSESDVSWSPDKLPKLDKFQLLEMVGRGAFGTVYRAKDTDLDRTVAIKIPRSGRFVSSDDEDRFAREARSVAQLSHPGIVAVFEVGHSADFPFIVAEYVDGVTLDELLRSRRLSFGETAVILVDLADALQHAHERGVVHRDIKPANIMLQPDDRRVPSESSGRWSKVSASRVGRPRLMDFGLARRDGGDATVTLEGQVLGTPAYMSPEQARGETSRIDARSDVYSLGVILHEMLTGEPPFRGTLRMLLHQVVHEDPPPPRKFNSHVPHELDTICLKCLEKEPEKRYQSAGDFADELRRFLNGEPIVARPPSPVGRMWRWCRRHPSTAVLSVCLLVTVATAIAATTTQWIRAEGNARRATEIAQRESVARNDAEQRAATLAEVVSFLNEVLGSANPAKLGRDVTVREAVHTATARIEASFQDDPAIEAAVRETLGITYRSLSEMDDAVFHFRRAVQLYRDTLGPDSLETLEAMNLLAGALRSRKHDDGDLVEAESIRRSVLASRLRIQGPDHPDTWAAMGNLGNVLATSGRDHEAIGLFQQSLAGNVKRFGFHSPAASTDRHNLASSLFATGNLEDAAAEFRKLHEQTRDAKDPESLLVKQALADVLHAQGKADEAKKLYQQTLKLRDEVLGPLHLHTLSTFRRFTRLLVEEQEFESALPLLQELLQRHDERIGADAGLTLGVRESMARTLEGLGRIDDAEQFRIATYTMHTQRRDQKYVSATRRQLIDFYRAQRQDAKAAALLAEE